MPNIQYFLGGNTPTGFYSLYHQLSDPTRMRALYIIKSGPGSGKSTLMRRVERHVQAAGLETQQVLCSGDPDSLDAVIIPELGAALVDGTAPQGVVPFVHFCLRGLETSKPPRSWQASLPAPRRLFSTAVVTITSSGRTSGSPA